LLSLAGEGNGSRLKLGVARNTVRRYVRDQAVPGVQVHIKQRRLDDAARTKAVSLFDGTVEGNAVVVQELLASDGVTAGVRTIQRAVEVHRREQRAAQVATVRFETAPGEQMQIDFARSACGSAAMRSS